MKWKTERKPLNPIKDLILPDDGCCWMCQNCRILYGAGETVKHRNESFLCPNPIRFFFNKAPCLGTLTWEKREYFDKYYFLSELP